METRSTLAARLRAETADLHAATEEAVGLPGTVRSRADYVRLLELSLAFYSAAHQAISSTRFVADFEAVGISLNDHDRLELLARDLEDLGGAADEADAPSLPIDTFAQALGCLYVVEGSSLGGRILGPAITASIGEVPIRFYTSEGRGHPTPWRRLQAALAQYDSADGDVLGVIDGAKLTFEAFGAGLRHERWADAA
jgi:heme oxygenase